MITRHLLFLENNEEKKSHNVKIAFGKSAYSPTKNKMSSSKYPRRQLRTVFSSWRGVDRQQGCKFDPWDRGLSAFCVQFASSPPASVQVPIKGILFYTIVGLSGLSDFLIQPKNKNVRRIENSTFSVLFSYYIGLR